MLGLEYRIKDLESDDKDVSLSLSREHLLDALGDLDVDLSDTTARLEVRLTKLSNTVQSDGWLRGRITLPCQRCLEPAHIPLELRLHTLYVPASMSGSPTSKDIDTDEAPDDDDLDYGHHNGEIVDLWPILREALILAVPITVHCKEDCLGLCPTCGIDRNTTSCACQPAAPLSPLATLSNLKLPT